MTTTTFDLAVAIESMNTAIDAAARCTREALESTLAFSGRTFSTARRAERLISAALPDLRGAAEQAETNPVEAADLAFRSIACATHIADLVEGIVGIEGDVVDTAQNCFEVVAAAEGIARAAQKVFEIAENVSAEGESDDYYSKVVAYRRDFATCLRLVSASRYNLYLISRDL